jgi:predicted fused transcriptional regulator/phosphomethylpyrimidine kinase
VSGLVIFLAVMRRSDTVGVRGKIVELGGSEVPVVSAEPGVVSSIASVAHEPLLYEIKLDCTTLISPAPRCLRSRP